MLQPTRAYSSNSFGALALLVPAVFMLGLLGGAELSSPGSQEAPSIRAEPTTPPLSAPQSHHLPAEVLRVIDGDTFEARVHVWPGLAVITKIRLRGVDAPELRARCAEEQRRAEAARDALQGILAAGNVGVFNVSLDKYGGRVVADAAANGTPNISAALLSRALARRYGGGHRVGWCSERTG